MGTTIKYPFCRKTGSLLSYSWHMDSDDTVEYRENFEFDDTLEYKQYRGGRSSMTMILRSTTTGAEYPMFWTFFEKFLLGEGAPTFSDGDGGMSGLPLRVSGRWTFCKMGQNYSIKPVGA